MDETETRNAALVREGLTAMAAGRLDDCMNLMRPDLIANLPGLSAPRVGSAAWREGAEAMRSAFPDLAIAIEDIFASGDRVAVRTAMSGTQRGDFAGLPATGRRIGIGSIEIYRM